MKVIPERVVCTKFDTYVFITITFNCYIIVIECFTFLIKQHYLTE